VWKKVNWILDADVQGFFDHLDHGHLLEFIQKRVGDSKGTAADPEMAESRISEDGKCRTTKVGTPQGAVISPFSEHLSGITYWTNGGVVAQAIRDWGHGLWSATRMTSSSGSSTGK